MVKKDVGMKIKMNAKCFKEIEILAQDKEINEAPIYDLLQFIDARYDCADFRVVSILKVIYEYADLISPTTNEAMKKTLLSFKYWIDEPGNDGMCYWSENHQILFATIEYLAGQRFPNEIFSNNQMTGRAHQHKATVRIKRWLQQRYQYGFTEWLSNTYYEEDIAALALLIDYCHDENIVQQATIIMDLLHLDLALHQFRCRFSASSGRGYEAQKKDPAQADVVDIMEHAFGTNEDYKYDYERISAVYVLRNRYEVPEAIRQIASSQQIAEIKQSMGLNLEEIKTEFEDLTDFENVGMYLWLMEAFTNEESIQLTMDMYREWHLSKNNFLKELKPFSFPILRPLLPSLIKTLNPATQGIAIQRANVYTYRHPDYMLSTAQRYHPGTFGDQQHIWQANLPQDISVFSTHPGAPMFGTAERNFSPSYWVGNGIQPHAVQYQNISFAFYDLSVRKGYLERERQLYTHLYFPAEKFDLLLFEDHLLCGQIENTYIGVISLLTLKQVAPDEFQQKGIKTGYVTILSSKDEYPTLHDFLDYLGNCQLHLLGDTLTFTDGAATFTFDYQGDFLVDGVVQAMEYPRFATPFVYAERKAEQFTIHANNHSLLLDFTQLRRELSHDKNQRTETSARPV